MVDLERIMIAQNGIGMGTSDGPIGSAGRINTSWFRLGYTQDSGIPGITPNTGPDNTDELGSADVDGTEIEYGTNGFLRTTKSDDSYTFKAFNPNVGAIPGNTLTTFVRVLGLWVPLTASPSGHVGLITSTISARVSKFPGRGFVSVQEIDDTDDLLKDTDPVTSLKVYNYSTATFQVGKYCWVEPDARGKIWLVSAEC
jgi:hypothetical protein